MADEPPCAICRDLSDPSWLEKVVVELDLDSIIAASKGGCPTCGVLAHGAERYAGRLRSPAKVRLHFYVSTVERLLALRFRPLWVGYERPDYTFFGVEFCLSYGTICFFFSFFLFPFPSYPGCK